MASGYDSATDTLKANNVSNAAGTAAPSFPGGVLSSGILSSSSATVNLTTTDNYRLVLLTLSGAQTVNLPTSASSTGRIISFKKFSNAGRVTLTPASGLIDGAASNDDIILAKDTVDLVCDGTNWYVLKKNLIPVALDCYKSGTQALTTTAAVVAYDTTTTDTHTALNTGTGVFTAPRAGTYIIRGSSDFTAASVINAETAVQKNGSVITGTGSFGSISTAGGDTTLAVFYVAVLAKNDTLAVQARVTTSTGTLNSTSTTLKPVNMQITEIPTMV